MTDKQAHRIELLLRAIAIGMQNHFTTVEGLIAIQSDEATELLKRNAPAAAGRELLERVLQFCVDDVRAERKVAQDEKTEELVRQMGAAMKGPVGKA